MSTDDRPNIEPLAPAKIRRYATTVLEIGDGPLEVDLREDLARGDAARVRQVAGAAEFTVITADNPRGQVRPESENQRERRALRQALERRGLTFVPVLGRDPEGPHREPGFGVSGGLEAVVELALRFGQDGLFRFDGERFWLVSSATGAAYPLPLQEGLAATD